MFNQDCHTPACSPLPFGGGLGRGADYEERNLEDYTSPCSKHYCFYHYRIGNYLLYKVSERMKNYHFNKVLITSAPSLRERAGGEADIYYGTSWNT